MILAGFSFSLTLVLVFNLSVSQIQVCLFNFLFSRWSTLWLILACDYLAYLSVKSVWQKFFSSALFVVDYVGSQNRHIFFGKGFGKSSLQLVSKSLNQFRFCLSKLAFGYLAFWKNIVFVQPVSLRDNFVFVGQGF